MDRMGLGYEALRRIKPDIIMIALSGYGATGPEREFVSYGPAQVPLSGMSSLTGYADWPPMHVGISYGDPTGGLHGAVAVLAALLHRAATGEGQYIDLSQQETSIAVLGEGVLEQSMTGGQPPRGGNRDPHMAPHGVFRCAGEQRWVAIAVRDDAEWQRCAAVDGPPGARQRRRASPRLAARKANEDDARGADHRVDAAAARRRRSPSSCSARGIPAAVSMHNRTSPRIRISRRAASSCICRIREVGTRLHLGMPWRMSDTPCAVRRPAPCLGEHTDDVLERVVGYSPRADRGAARSAGCWCERATVTVTGGQ